MKEHLKTAFWIIVILVGLSIIAAITIVYWSIWSQYKDVPVSELPAWVYQWFFGGE